MHIDEPVAFVALSMGGKAAVNFSLTYPQRTNWALVLADVAIDGYSFKNFKLEPIYEAAKQKGVDTANQLFLDNPIFSFTRSDSIVFSDLRNMIFVIFWLAMDPQKPNSRPNPPAMQQLDQIKRTCFDYNRRKRYPGLPTDC